MNKHIIITAGLLLSVSASFAAHNIELLFKFSKGHAQQESKLKGTFYEMPFQGTHAGELATLKYTIIEQGHHFFVKGKVYEKTHHGEVLVAEPEVTAHRNEQGCVHLGTTNGLSISVEVKVSEE